MPDSIQKDEIAKCDVCAGKPSVKITLGTAVGTKLDNPHGFSIYLCSACIQAAAKELNVA